jgi:anti-anti-sigma factor
LRPTEPPGKGDAWFLTLSSEDHSDRIVWHAAGRLGAAGATVLLDTLKPSPSNGLRLVLDLDGVDYVSGAGVRAIETIAKAAQDAGGSLELVNLTEPVRICLELAGPLSCVASVLSG